MNKFIKSILDLNELEQFARRNSYINRINPTIKILITLIYIILVTSVGKYEVSTILMFGVYPIIVFSFADIPLNSIVSKLFVPVIFSISLGLFNPFIDKEILISIGIVKINGGSISLLVLVIKAILSISSTLLLVATTSITDIGRGLENLWIPKKLVVLLLLMYRYISVLLNEVSKTIDAYHLRTGNNKGIHISTWGSLVGQIMIRAYRRSEEIYSAMLLRGYHTGEYNENS